MTHVEVLTEDRALHSEGSKLALDACRDKLLACVHCGLCLEACPTYTHTGDENDSPRGRIYLMRAVKERRLAPTARAFARHIDRCLGCRACERACPAGVEYGQLLEAARADLLPIKGSRNMRERLLRFALDHIWPNPKRLHLVFALLRRARDAKISGALSSLLLRLRLEEAAFPLLLLQASAPNMKRENPIISVTAQGQATERVLLFLGCVTEGLFARINRATARVLSLNGYEVRIPRAQVCCGALHAHAGDVSGAKRLARWNIEAFSEDEAAPIITNAGGCGAMLLSYAHLFAEDPAWAERARRFSQRVRDISQQLVQRDLRRGAPLNTGPVTYDASCHLLYGQKAEREPLRMLEAIPELKLVPLEGSERCCGGAGVYNLLEPELSQSILREKLAHIGRTEARILATGNPGCHMQIAAGAIMLGMKLEVYHPVELLDLSYERAGFYAIKAQDRRH